MILFKLMFFAAALLRAAQPASPSLSPEDMYQEYITPETRALLDEYDRAMEQTREAEEAARTRRTLALVFSLAVGLIPVVHIGRRAIRQKSWRQNPDGTARALGVALLGGVVLFGLNYGIFLLRLKLGDAFPLAFAFLAVAALIALAILLLRKKS